MRMALREFRHGILSPLTLFSGLVASVTTTFSGPFGTFATMTIGIRAFYWTSIVAVSIIVIQFAYSLSRRLLGAGQPFLRDAVAILLTVALFSPALWLISIDSVIAEPQHIPQPATQFAYVFLIAVLVVSMRRVMILAMGGPIGLIWAKEFKDHDASPYEMPRLAVRLSQPVDVPIMRLTVRDHLVDVVSKNQTETLRMRFTDAISEMEPVVGYCTHRSHWVCRDAISEVTREPGGKIYLHLHNGDKVPVSRKYRPGLEAAGIVGSV